MTLATITRQRLHEEVYKRFPDFACWPVSTIRRDAAVWSLPGEKRKSEHAP